MPEFTSRPQQYPLIGALGRALGTADQFARKPFGYSNPPVEIISDLLQIPALARTAENINYGSPLTQGTGQARRLTKDTTGAIEGALNLAPLAGPAMKAMKGRPIGLMVKAEGNLNLRPSVIAENLKGPDKQKVGDFIKQVNAMKGLTKEGKQMALTKLREMDQSQVVTKQFIEDSFEPSRFGKIDLKGAAQNAEAHLEQEARNMAIGRDDLDELFSQYLGFDSDPIVGRKLNAVRNAISPEAQLEALERLPIGVKEDLRSLGVIRRDGSLNATQLDAYHDEMMSGLVDHELEFLRMNYDPGAGDYTYRDYQRLTFGDDRGYVEKGVSHPDAPATYHHFPESSEPMVSHFRGSGDMSKARLFNETDTTFDLDPNSFVIEELQSDVQKGIKQEGPYHLPHATAFKAAVQHALEQGHDTVYLPTAKTIAGVRGKDAASFAPIYDQEVVNYGLSPLTRMEGVTVEPIFGGEDIAYHKIKIGPEAKTEILEGKGQSLPGFAGGGKVDKQEFRATPRSGVLGTIADATKKLHDYYLKAQAGYANPVTETISNLLGIPAFAEMMDRMSYGEPLTKGRGETLQLKPWAVEGLASLPAGVATETSLRVIKSLPGALKHASQEFAKASVAGAPHVIKPKGAQTITEHLGSQLGSLKFRPNVESNQRRRTQIERMLAEEEEMPQESRQSFENVLRNMTNDEAIDKWIDSTLRKYLIRDMGTPDDPLVRLAEQGISHSPHMRGVAAAGEVGEITTPYLANVRETLGFPRKGSATTPLGQAVEAQTDFATGMPFKNTTEAGQGFTARNRVGLDLPEWTKKLDPETNLYAPSPAGLEFQHMIDVLAEDLATGRIRPEQMSKISMEQAVRRTQQYDDELAAAMDASKAAARAGLPVHREYNSGYRWIELNKPGSFAAESDAMGHSVRGYEPPRGHPDWVEASGNSGHESYGHGGWEAIKSGRAKVYSLVDDKGQPHATVEVKTPDLSGIINRLPNEEYRALGQPIRERHFGGSHEQAMANYSEYNKLLEQAYLEKYGEPPAIITQIKGKQNTAPAPDYQPYVADFVRQGNWSPDVGDLNYTDLVRIGDKFVRRPEFEQIMQEQQYGQGNDPSFMLDWAQRFGRMDPSTLSETDQQMLEAIRNFTPPEMKAGGGVDFGKLLSEAVSKYSQPAMAEGGTVDVERLRAAYFGG